MKIVDINELCKMPANTMYAVIKENEGDNNFINPRIIIDSFDDGFNGVRFLLPEVFEHYATKEICYNWGLLDESSNDFENNEKFVIFEKEDLLEIQNIINKALNAIKNK